MRKRSNINNQNPETETRNPKTEKQNPKNEKMKGNTVNCKNRKPVKLITLLDDPDILGTTKTLKQHHQCSSTRTTNQPIKKILFLSTLLCAVLPGVDCVYSG